MENPTIVFIGATGAVGSAAFNQLLTYDNVSKILTLGRRVVDLKEPPAYLEQQIIDIHNPESYSDYIRNILIPSNKRETSRLLESTKCLLQEYVHSID